MLCYLNKNKKTVKIIALLLVMVMVIGGTVATNAQIARGCSVPCPTVHDVSLPQQAIKWAENFAKPYADRLNLEQDIITDIGRKPGKLGSVVDEYFRTSAVYSERARASVRNFQRFQSARYADGVNNYQQKLNKTREVYAVRVYEEANAMYWSTRKFDIAIRKVRFRQATGIGIDRRLGVPVPTFNPMVAIIAPVGVTQKSAAQLGIMQTNILASYLKLMGMEQEYASLTKR
jgi:hypothetical protein